MCLKELQEFNRFGSLSRAFRPASFLWLSGGAVGGFELPRLHGIPGVYKGYPFEGPYEGILREHVTTLRNAAVAFVECG